MINKAIKYACSLKSNKYRLCSIITDKKHNILSIGYNSYTRTHPKQAYYAIQQGHEKRIFLHSEIASIINLPYGCKPYHIYVARVNAKGQPRLAKPCNICTNAIQDIGIKNIYYTE